MNTDFYAECLVARTSGGAVLAKKIAVGVLAVLLAFFAVMYLFLVGPLIALAVVYGAYYIITGMDVEYEYILTNGELDVDKIMGKRKRKRLITAEISEFTSFGRLSDAPDEPESCTTVLAADGTGKNEYYADLVHKTAGNVRIIFTPSEKILDGVELFLPRQLRVEFKRKRQAG